MRLAALEALERLALDYTAVEAERIAALGCAEYLGQLLHESQEALAISTTRRQCKVAAQKESADEISARCQVNLDTYLPNGAQAEAVSPSFTDTTNASTPKCVSFESCSSPEACTSDADAEKVQLSAISRHLGVLRAQCAQQQDCTAELDEELSRSQRDLQERSSSVEALRGCIAKLREALELRKENHIGADTTLPDASHAILQGRSDLHRLTCELMQMDMRCSEMRSVCVAEREVQCMEEERWQEERRHLEMNEAAEQKVVQAEHAELEAMHEAIRCEASQASALRWSESEHAARLDALRAQKRRNLISDKAQLDAWRHEIYAHQLEAQKMNATIQASCRQAEAAAGEAAFISWRIFASSAYLTQSLPRQMARQMNISSQKTLACPQYRGTTVVCT